MDNIAFDVKYSINIGLLTMMKAVNIFIVMVMIVTNDVVRVAITKDMFCVVVSLLSDFTTCYLHLQCMTCSQLNKHADFFFLNQSLF